MQMEQRTARSLPSRSSMRWLALVCALLLAAGVLPLYAISLCNHPYYDDYGFSADVRETWRETGDLGATLATAWANARNIRQTWQGTYTGTLLSNLQPGVFSESLYYWTTFILLTACLLCFGFLVKTVCKRMGASREEIVIVVCLTLFLLTQFLPDVGEAFYWFNGGIGNAFIYSLLALSAALCLRLDRARSRAGFAGLTLALLLLSLMIGGGSYCGGLFATLGYAVLCVWAFARKRAGRWAYLASALWLVACFLYSVSAPGNTVRATMINAKSSPVVAVAKALYYGVALMGSYTRLPLIAVALLFAPMMARWARASACSFKHPWLVLLGGACLYCSQLTPTLYSGVFLGGGRSIDTYYMSYIVLFLLYEGYLIGWLTRRRDFALPTDVARRTLLVASACLLLVGCLGYKRPNDTLYGPMNMAGGSAALSLMKGEAAQYDAEMSAREALLNDETQATVTLKPLSVVPRVFMRDLLAVDTDDDPRSALCAYYHKDAILVEGGDAQ